MIASEKYSMIWKSVQFDSVFNNLISRQLLDCNLKCFNRISLTLIFAWNYATKTSFNRISLTLIMCKELIFATGHRKNLSLMQFVTYLAFDFLQKKRMKRKCKMFLISLSTKMFLMSPSINSIFLKQFSMEKTFEYDFLS